MLLRFLIVEDMILPIMNLITVEVTKNLLVPIDLEMYDLSAQDLGQEILVGDTEITAIEVKVEAHQEENIQVEEVHHIEEEEVLVERAG